MLFADANGEPLSYWIGFAVFVLAMLALDLGVIHRKSKEPTFRESAAWTAVWIALAFMFAGLLWYLLGPQDALLYVTGYLTEKALSMDNVFVFAVIFSFFRVPKKYQYRVLFWGILGAVVMRLVFILLGVELIKRFDWITYVLGFFLVYTGIKLAFHQDNVDPEKSWVLRLARRWFPVAKGNDHGGKFFVREAGKLCITPLFLVLLVVESSDVAFAVDSVPAILAITKDPFLVFTSNIFAILGLRALYFMLAGVMGLFRYLHYGLSAILVFVGLKMLLHWVADPPLWWTNNFGDMPEWARHWIGEPPPWLTLSIVMGLLAISVIASLIAAKYDPQPLELPVASSEDLTVSSSEDLTAGPPTSD